MENKLNLNLGDWFVGQLFENAWYFSDEFDATDLKAAIDYLKIGYPNGFNLVPFLEERLEEKLDDEDDEEEAA
jgi:hypothetical protein